MKSVISNYTRISQNNHTTLMRFQVQCEINQVLSLTTQLWFTIDKSTQIVTKWVYCLLSFEEKRQMKILTTAEERGPMTICMKIFRRSDLNKASNIRTDFF